MAYPSLGRGALICIWGLEGCGGNVTDADTGSSASGGSTSPNPTGAAGSGAASTLDAGVLQDTVGTDNQFIPITDKFLTDLAATACSGTIWECEPESLLRSTVCGVVQCSIPVPKPPAGSAVDIAKVNVGYQISTGIGLIRMNSAADCQYGWHFSSDYSTIEICPKSCEALKCNAYASIFAFFGCAHGPVIT